MSTQKASRAYTSCITSDDIYVDEPYLSIDGTASITLCTPNGRQSRPQADRLRHRRDRVGKVERRGRRRPVRRPRPAATEFVTEVPISSRGSLGLSREKSSTIAPAW